MNTQTFQLYVYSLISKEFLFIPYYAHFQKTYTTIAGSLNSEIFNANLIISTIYNYYSQKYPFNISINSISSINDINETFIHKLKHNFELSNTYNSKYPEYKLLIESIRDYCHSFDKSNIYKLNEIGIDKSHPVKIDIRQLVTPTPSHTTSLNPNKQYQLKSEIISEIIPEKNIGQIRKEKNYTRAGKDYRFVSIDKSIYENIQHILNINSTSISPFEKENNCISFRLFMKHLLLFISNEHIQHDCSFNLNTNNKQHILINNLFTTPTETHTFDLRDIPKYLNIITTSY